MTSLLTIMLLLALGLTVASAFGKCPLWVPVALVICIMLVGRLPLG